jgi:hypothetical protein
MKETKYFSTDVKDLSTVGTDYNEPVPVRNRSPSRNGVTASWVIITKDTDSIVMETWQASMVRKLNTEKYYAVAIQDYLADLNREIKNA